MAPSGPARPPTLQRALAPCRFLFHADAWPVFLCALAGLPTGHPALACVRASLLTAGAPGTSAATATAAPATPRGHPVPPSRARPSP